MRTGLVRVGRLGAYRVGTEMVSGMFEGLQPATIMADVPGPLGNQSTISLSDYLKLQLQHITSSQVALQTGQLPTPQSCHDFLLGHAINQCNLFPEICPSSQEQLYPLIDSLCSQYTSWYNHVMTLYHGAVDSGQITATGYAPPPPEGYTPPVNVRQPVYAETQVSYSPSQPQNNVLQNVAPQSTGMVPRQGSNAVVDQIESNQIAETGDLAADSDGANNWVSENWMLLAAIGGGLLLFNMKK